MNSNLKGLIEDLSNLSRLVNERDIVGLDKDCNVEALADTVNLISV